MEYVIQACWELASCQQICMTYTIAVLTVKTPDDGQRNCSKHVEFCSKNKFEKLVRLVGLYYKNLSRCTVSWTLKILQNFTLNIFGFDSRCACNQNILKLHTFVGSRLLSRNLKIKIYRTIILPVVLYGRETWSLTLREERKLKVFENKVLRRIFVPRRDEVTGEWKRLHNEEINYP